MRCCWRGSVLKPPKPIISRCKIPPKSYRHKIPHLFLRAIFMDLTDPPNIPRKPFECPLSALQYWSWIAGSMGFCSIPNYLFVKIGYPQKRIPKDASFHSKKKFKKKNSLRKKHFLKIFSMSTTIQVQQLPHKS
jgi:hypothetical protein